VTFPEHGASVYSLVRKTQKEKHKISLSDAVVPDLVVRRSIAVDLYGQKLTYTKVDLVLCSDKAG
jgi:hypothetical protein